MWEHNWWKGPGECLQCMLKILLSTFAYDHRWAKCEGKIVGAFKRAQQRKQSTICKGKWNTLEISPQKGG